MSRAQCLSGFYPHFCAHQRPEFLHLYVCVSPNVCQTAKLVILLPQSRDGRLWAAAQADAASTKPCSPFRSQGPTELQSGLTAPCLCPV